jgi:hypothetical protein
MLVSKMPHKILHIICTPSTTIIICLKVLHPCNSKVYGCKVGKLQFYIHVTRKVMDVKWEDAILHPCNSKGYGCKVRKM